MFRPQAMTEIELVVPTKDLLAVTKLLSGQGIFQQTDSSYLGSEKASASPNPWQEKAAAYAGLERRIQNVMQTLGIEEGLSPDTEPDALTEIDSVRPVLEQIEQEVKHITDQLSDERKKKEQFENTLHQLEPLAEIDLDVSSLHDSHFLISILGTMPVEHVERLQTSLSRIPFVFLPLREDNQKAVVWLAGAQNNKDILERAARSAYLTPFSLPDGYQGTPAEIIKLLNGNIQDAEKNISALDKEITRLQQTHCQKLQPMLWDTRASRMMADAIVRYGRLQRTYLIVGWVASSRLEYLSQKIGQISKESLIETFPAKRSAKNENVPILLKNPSFLGSFQMLVTTYGQPRYNELDPTLLLAVMFPLIFGTMFGDVGQGLVLAFLGGLLASKKVKALNSMSSLGGLLIACGGAAMVFGFLYGSIFGFETVINALWMRPIDNILTILEITIGAGLVVLSLGFLLGIYNAIMARDWAHLFFDHYGIAGLVLYWSLLAFGAGAFLVKLPIPQIVFIILIAISGLVVMFSDVFKRLIEGHRPLIDDSFPMYFIQAFFELFETLISFLGNSLSYVRVGAFAVAHGGLSAAFFILAELVSPAKGIGYWITLVIGNIFIIGLEGLIVGIQTMRLSYYEFFSKFFTGGGTRYEPLTLHSASDK
jgi:V/A-type H+-transporting ATPase subunit I